MLGLSLRYELWALQHIYFSLLKNVNDIVKLGSKVVLYKVTVNDYL